MIYDFIQNKIEIEIEIAQHLQAWILRIGNTRQVKG
jgi:hypothetical protein